MPAYEKSVFINCPFDETFAPRFHAIVLTVAALDFEPRCARESEGVADPRNIRIARGLAESKYSIHDLSRFQGEGADNLARFNMPLELGMALAIRVERSRGGNPHNWTALVPPGFVHQRFISDLAGYDLPVCDQTPASTIKAVASWLRLQPDFVPPAPSAKAIYDAYPQFIQLLDQARIDALDVLSWPDILEAAANTIAGIPF